MIEKVRDLRVSFQVIQSKCPKRRRIRGKKGTKRLCFKLKQGSPFEPCEPVTVHRTGWSDCGPDNSMLFSHETVLHLKWTVDVNGSRVSRSDRTVRSGFKFHAHSITNRPSSSIYQCYQFHSVGPGMTRIFH